MDPFSAWVRLIVLHNSKAFVPIPEQMLHYFMPPRQVVGWPFTLVATVSLVQE